MASDRLNDHQKAELALLDLNFFYKGKGMIISPDLIKFYEASKKIGLGLNNTGILNKRWGVITQDRSIKGIFNEPYLGMQIGVLGCVACHSGKAAGEYIVGLGNKTIDVGQIGSDVYKVQKMWGKIPHKNPEFKKIHDSALEFTYGLATNRLTNETQGLVPTSLIRSWFYKMAGAEVPLDFPKGLVKVPHLWGYGEKRKTGSFWDGEANGVEPGWAVAVELYAGQTVEHVREYLPKVYQAEEYLSHLLPPKYPFKINLEKAKLGEKVYQNSCYKCHGSHIRDENNFPIYDSPKHIPLKVVKTDGERLRSNTSELYNLISQGPLSDLMQAWPREEKGYVAPKLWGIWSRFPYLHNGSVPTIIDLLSKPEFRPKAFSLIASGERENFDEKKLGLKLNKKIKTNLRSTYDTTKLGQSNQGHYFESFDHLSSDDKENLIEFLKTL